MKKVLCYTLALMLCLSLCACQDDIANATTNTEAVLPEGLTALFSGDWYCPNMPNHSFCVSNASILSVTWGQMNFTFFMTYVGDNEFKLYDSEGEGKVYLGSILFKELTGDSYSMVFNIDGIGSDYCIKEGENQNATTPSTTVPPQITNPTQGTEPTQPEPTEPESPMMSYLYGEWLPMEGTDEYRPAYIRIERGGKCYTDRFGELEWRITSETQDNITVEMIDDGKYKCNISVQIIDGEITGWYWAQQSSAYAFYNARLGEFEFPTIAERMAPYCGTWYNIDGNDPQTLILREDHTLTIGNETHEVGLSFYEHHANGHFATGVYANFQIIYEDKTNIHMITEYGVYSMEETKQPVTVEITKENWQEYFELRTVEVKRYNAFGDLEQEEYGQTLYLKEEYLDKLLRDEVYFKVNKRFEYWEWDDSADQFVEGGRLYKTVYKEDVREVFDNRHQTEVKFMTSTLFGQVYCDWFAVPGTVVNSVYYDEAGVAYQARYEGFEVIDVTGTLTFKQ